MLDADLISNQLVLSKICNSGHWLDVHQPTVFPLHKIERKAIDVNADAREVNAQNYKSSTAHWIR